VNKKIKRNKIQSLYIHIPFCENICSYCDFPKLFYFEKLADQYLLSLENEINAVITKQKFKTIYIGGGTPLALNLSQLYKLLSLLKPYQKAKTEYTIETNIENITDEKIALLVKYGVNRISIGVQTFSQEGQRYLGRKTDKESLEIAVEKLKKAGIWDINLDFLYAYRGLTKTGIDEIINEIDNLKVSHISFYPLQIEEATKLYNQNEKELDGDIVSKQYKYISSRLSKIGYKQYEVSNYYRLKKANHNLTYWHDEYFYGIGLGAASYYNETRFINTKSINQYNRLDYATITESVDYIDNIKEYIMLNLRLSEGINVYKFKEKFNIDFSCFDEVTNEFVNKKMLKRTNKAIKTTKKSIMLLNSIIVQYYLLVEKLEKNI